MAWGEQHLGCAELDEWEAYFRLEPMESRRADWRAAMLAALLENMLLGPKPPAQIGDYMPVFFRPALNVEEVEAQERKETEERQKMLLQKIELLNRAFGGKDLRHGDSSKPGR